jgi:NAD(P)H-hydrate epimerase
VIATPEGGIAINGSGNPGMASGGMGDVLTGLITSLLCQGYSPFDACRLGVFIHGYSADLLAGEKGEIGITATDLIENLPGTFKRLLTRSPVYISHSATREEKAYA